ncbi:MAG: proton-conducting transporter membrane subunit [Gemmataceae bacterium]
MPLLDLLQQTSPLTLLGVLVVAAPAVLVAVLGIPSLLDRPLSERAAARAVAVTTGVGLAAVVAVFVLMLTGDTRHVVVGLGDWVHIGRPEPDPHYHFAVTFVFDRLSVPFAALSLVLCGTIGAFAVRYMHREPGYNRFFVLYAVFMAGMVITSLAGTIETLFAGWELVGLSSALLVAFFQERPAPSRNGLRVWTVYRVSDAALLLAAVILHHMSGEGNLDRVLGPGPWPHGEVHLSGAEVLVVGALVLVAAAGKSALVPFSGWLPRAMEGPTPSSAVFYGALSVHLGAFLLLRVSPLLDTSAGLSAAVLALGLATAAYAALAGRVQTDIKSALSFASLTQVGLIVAEVGAGYWLGEWFRYVPLVHLLGHACLRTLQFVRAPTFLQDRRALENAIGARLPPPGVFGRPGLYRFALERGYLDAVLTDYVARPFAALFRWFDALERRATAALAGTRAPGDSGERSLSESA